MNAIMAVHIAAGSIALGAGALALAFRKGARVHALSGRTFVVGMLVLGGTAAILGPMKAQPDTGMVFAGVLVAYFVLTSWWTARNREGRAGKFEVGAAIIALGCATLFGAHGIEVLSGQPAGMERNKAFASIMNAGFCLLAGIGDVAFLVRRTLTRPQRLARHLWRMCFALFIATGSFFLGQQDVMPAVMRGSPLLAVLAFAPFGFLVFWLVRVRVARAYRGPSRTATPAVGVAALAASNVETS